MIVTPIATKIVGVTFVEDYPQNIFRISSKYVSENSEVRLEREPDNQYDCNAIKVWVAGEFVGHIPALIAKSIAPEMDKGISWVADIDSILVSVENMNNPGIKILIWRENETA